MLAEMTFGLVHVRYSLPDWQALKLSFFALSKRGEAPSFSVTQHHSRGKARIKLDYEENLWEGYLWHACPQIKGLSATSLFIASFL